MKIAEFDYILPQDLIAQRPAPARDQSRLMVLCRKDQTIVHGSFRDLPKYLEAGDCLVINDTKVIPARLEARRRSGGKVEILLLEEVGEGGKLWSALTKSSRRLAVGEILEISPHQFEAEVVENLPDGLRLLRFQSGNVPLNEMLHRFGYPPLPPYIRRTPSAEDRERYQTTYAQAEGAVAAPTAGLHFTEEMLQALRERGVEIAGLTLHIGLGTFRPVTSENVEEHSLQAERFILVEECAALINSCRAGGGRVFAVGTSVVRALESCSGEEGKVYPAKGETALFIYPGYRFKVVDALLTNFHLPRSSLLLLVCAFAGTDFVLGAYQEAVKERYRFYSYGDCMLILP